MATVRAHFDGRVFVPESPVELPVGYMLEIAVPGPNATEADTSTASRNPAELVDKLESDCGLVDGPEDWASEHDHHLYGAAKKCDGSTD